MDVVITGASRGIGRALALAVAHASRRLVLVARDAERLSALASAIAAGGGHAVPLVADLSTRAGSAAVGRELAGLIEPGATLVHNAGLWPVRRELVDGGLERAFVVNYLAPLLLQAPLLSASAVTRVMTVGAGLMVKGRFSPERTPTGLDFSRFRTYATTKLALACAQRDVAAAYPDVDFLVIHPGVVRTDLGAAPGLLGALLRLVKRSWEAPEICAERLARVLGQSRWSAGGEARWFFEESPQAWPAVADSSEMRAAVRNTTARFAVSTMAPWETTNATAAASSLAEPT
jgi:NAD(P)-dependent dehydrogenase (short-subunit alcohol dehydrogenase family)